jgi:hypothetical protein
MGRLPLSGVCGFMMHESCRSGRSLFRSLDFTAFWFRRGQLSFFCFVFYLARVTYQHTSARLTHTCRLFSRHLLCVPQVCHFLTGSIFRKTRGLSGTANQEMKGTLDRFYSPEDCQARFRMSCVCVLHGIRFARAFRVR